MKTTIELLDALKIRRGFRSDYQVAKLFETSTSRIGNYRSGRTCVGLTPGTWRAAWYAKHWNVPDKIRHAKTQGAWPPSD